MADLVGAGLGAWLRFSIVSSTINEAGSFVARGSQLCRSDSGGESELRLASI